MAKFTAFIALLFIATTTATVATASQGWKECTPVIADMSQLPWEPPGAVRICRSGVLAISYDVGMLCPAFSMYHITPDQAKNLLPGRDSFYEDPDLQATGIQQAPVNSKAFSQEWNRGHLAPNHLMSFSKVGKKSCFTMANIAPQAGYFNQQPWNELESNVATWIAGHEELYIVTGVAYNNRTKPARTNDNIAVPDYYWKVLCAPKSKEAVGFYGANTQSMKKNVEFLPVTSIEAMYGGRILPPNVCNTAAVNRAHWW